MPNTAQLSLPSLEVGAGNRRDECRLYLGCLDRWARSPHSSAVGKPDKRVRCPDGCSFLAEAPKPDLYDFTRRAVNFNV